MKKLEKSILEQVSEVSDCFFDKTRQAANARLTPNRQVQCVVCAVRVGNQWQAEWLRGKRRGAANDDWADPAKDTTAADR